MTPDDQPLHEPSSAQPVGRSGDERDPPDVWLSPPPPRPKFQHRYRTHIILFVLTVATTTLMHGPWYSLAILTILGAHEFGHYFACRWYDVDASLPYFLPAPLPLTGTVGAVIRIREPFPSKRALFDIGIAGPIAGFVALLPFLWWGVSHASILPVSAVAGRFDEFGEPLLFKAAAFLTLGPVPDGSEVFIGSVAFGAWFGMLATAMNLMPFGQLDGGHVAYALLGPRARWVSIATLVVMVSLTLNSLSWLVMTLLMIAMTLIIGVGHPQVVDEHVPLNPTRKALAVFAVVMFVLCFTPVPLSLGP